MQPLVVINVVGLAPAHLGPWTPHISSVARDGFACPLGTVLPAVTCSAQATMLTGTLPREHGIVGNGWYFRDLAEILFWRQSNHLIQREPFYRTARQIDPAHTTAKMFWWYNMYSGADWSLTPRPCYPADGRKLFDSYSEPAELKDTLQAKYGVFPLFRFWGPTAGIESSEWIANASCDIWRGQKPALELVYLPHLDYDFQRFGPDSPQAEAAVRAVDVEAGKLIAAARERDARIVILSEYAIAPVHQPVAINRALREAGLLTVRREIAGWETLDAGASRAFAVADHQVAHVYVNDARDLDHVKTTLERLPGVDRVLDDAGKREFGLDHPRAGDLVALAAPEAWFTYYFWLDDRLAPDYARTVDIHRKPGYDPMELFVDPAIRFPKLRIASRLARKLLGFRYYMDMIALDGGLIRGSHGLLPRPGREANDGPVFVCSDRSLARDSLAMTDVRDLLLKLQFPDAAIPPASRAT